MLSGWILVLTGSAAFATCTDLTQVAVAEPGLVVDDASPPPMALHPAVVQHLRKVYIGLRQTAYDACIGVARADATPEQEQCFVAELDCLVQRDGDPSLARYHAYIRDINQPRG